MALNPGDRVRLAELDDTETVYCGKVIHIEEITYRVRWDDGKEEIVEGSLLELEDS